MNIVNYGYGPGTPKWKSKKKGELAEKISKLLEQLRNENKIPSVPASLSPDGIAPYIEVDQMYKGVRIRKITHLSEEQQDDLIKRADAIYNEVMK